MCMSLIPALERQKQVGLCEFKTILVYRVSFRTAKAIQRNFVLKNKTNKQTKKDYPVLFCIHGKFSPQTQ